jgi:hypothetical protein
MTDADPTMGAWLSAYENMRRVIDFETKYPPTKNAEVQGHKALVALCKTEEERARKLGVSLVRDKE